MKTADPDAGTSRGESPPRGVLSGISTADGRFGGFEIGRRIGKGGMAEVYEAVRAGPHGFYKRVALKRILSDLARDPVFVRMFIDEAKLAARLEHPNIVQVFDFGEDEGELFLAMELIDGSSVNQILRAAASRGEAVPLESALYITHQCARALAYAHKARDDEGLPLRIVHRDVSPSNMLVTRTGHVKLADFGIAKAVFQKKKSGEGNVRGKLGYMSPEQVLNRPLDGRSDVFSLSIVLAEMLLGETLFSRGSELQIMLRIRDVDLGVLRDTRRRIPSDLRRLLLAGLSRDPLDRPDARGFARALQAIINRAGFRDSGADSVARLLFRYQLVSESPEEREAGEQGNRTAEFCSLSAVSEMTGESEIRRVLSRLDLSAQATYRVLLPDGRRKGPVPFPELVRLTTTGAVDADTPVARNRQRFRKASDQFELQRYFATPGLQWQKEELRWPCLQGELKAAVLLPLIHSLAINRETGLLYLEDGKRRKKVYFVDGRPDFIASNDRREMLGEYLVKTGKCLPMEVDMALAVLPRFGGRLGDALVSLGVLRPIELFHQVTSQVRSRYLEAFRWRSGTWKYVRKAQSQEQTYPLGQDNYLLLRDAALELDPSELESALSPLWEKVLLPSAMPHASLSAYGVPDEWRYVLEQARGDTTVGSILARSSATLGIEAETALRALFLGVSCQLITTA
jgi:serine/threonine protein kinase